MYNEIERRSIQRNGGCRGCNRSLYKGDKIIYTYTSLNRGQSILFCLDCAKVIGELSVAEEDCVIAV